MRRGARSPLLDAALVVVALIWIGPYLWMLSTSFKTLPEIVQAPAYPLPASLNTEAYAEVLTSELKMNLLRPATGATTTGSFSCSR